MKNSLHWSTAALVGIVLALLVPQNVAEAQQTGQAKKCDKGCVGEEDFDVYHFTEGTCDGADLSVTLDVNNGTCSQVNPKKCKRIWDCEATWIVDGSGFPAGQDIVTETSDGTLSGGSFTIFQADAEGNLLETDQMEVMCDITRTATVEAFVCDVKVSATGKCTKCPE